MHLVDLHVPTSRRSLELNPDLRSLAATQAKRNAASDFMPLRHRGRRLNLDLSDHESAEGTEEGSGETLCHDIYHARPITTVSLAANTYCMMDGLSSLRTSRSGPQGPI